MQLIRLTTIAAAIVLAVGFASPSFAAKKKAAPKPAEPNGLMCIQPSHPVCGVRGGERFTYANPCFAEKDGAKVVSQGACKPAKAGKKAKKGAMKGGKKPMKKSAKKKK
jgi:hypothetical protein